MRQRPFNNKNHHTSNYLILYLAAICCFLLLPSVLWSQEKRPEVKKPKATLHDTLDGKLDFSSFLLDPKGFMPIPVIITEKALGGFGGLLIPIFIKPLKSAKTNDYTPPDVTGAFGMYTANNSWAIGAFRAGSFPKWSMKYRIGIGYADVNLSFYHSLPETGDKEFSFNVGTMPLLASLSKKIHKKNIYLGMQYLYMLSNLKPRFKDSLPDFIKNKELDNHTAGLGVFLDWDERNTIFTPDKGYRINLLYSLNDHWTGSDFNYQQFNAALNWFVPMKKTWISGFRAEVQHVFDDPPFYMLPSISLRGIPALRYQGATTVLAETEQRIDISTRWSLVGFGGLAKAIEKNKSFNDALLLYNVGGGFRFLISRLFKIRAGIDLARGTDSFGYYIVFGHNWNR